MTKIPELKQFLINQNENDTESPSKKELNNSIRKKLFDLNSDDLSSSTTTTTITLNNPHPAFGSSRKPFQLDPVPKFKSSIHHKNSINKLPKPNIVSSTSESVSVNGVDTVHKTSEQTNKLKTLASSSDSNDECWRDSFEFDDHQFASSPKFDKYSNVMHDIGGDLPGEDLNDSVFLTTSNHHRTPPDVSPLLGNNKGGASLLHHSHGGSTLLPASSLLYNKKSNLDSNNSSSVELNSDDDFKHLQKSSLSSSTTKSSLHRNRYFCFEEASVIHNKENMNGSFTTNNLVKSAKKSEKMLTSPNLSPIRQGDLLVGEKSRPSSLGKKTSSKKTNKANRDEDETNMSTIESAPALGPNNSRSIIFMETCVNKQEKENENGQNVSFTESIVNHEHHGHYPREEFYSKKLFHESENPEVIDAEINDTYRNSNNMHSHKKSAMFNKSASSNMMHDEKQNSFLIPSSSADVSRANSSIVTKQSSINTTANTLVQKGKRCILYKINPQSRF